MTTNIIGLAMQLRLQLLFVNYLCNEGRYDKFKISSLEGAKQDSIKFDLILL